MEPAIKITVQHIKPSAPPISTDEAWLAEAVAYIIPEGGKEPVVVVGVVSHKDKERAVLHSLTECETQIKAIRDVRV